jgi:hypothetical protein
MERTGSQKLLKGLSIFNIVASTLSLLMGALVIVGGAMIASGHSSAAIQDLIQRLSLPSDQAGPLFIVMGIAILLACAFEIVTGVFGVRAAHDNTKIKPAWIFTLISLIAAVAAGAVAIVGGNATPSIAVSLGLSGLAFYAANRVKTEAGI